LRDGLSPRQPGSQHARSNFYRTSYHPFLRSHWVVLTGQRGTARTSANPYNSRRLTCAPTLDAASQMALVQGSSKCLVTNVGLELSHACLLYLPIANGMRACRIGRDLPVSTECRAATKPYSNTASAAVTNETSTLSQTVWPLLATTRFTLRTASAHYKVVPGSQFKKYGGTDTSV
jgi:hypothetical protein